MFPGMDRTRTTLSKVSQCFLQSPYDRYWLLMFVVVHPDQPLSLFTVVQRGVGKPNDESGGARSASSACCKLL